MPASAAWGSWVNAVAKRDYGRPLFIAASADLADSTNLAGFGQGLRRAAGLRVVRARHEPAGRAAAHRDHRVHQRRDDGRARDGQPRIDDPFASFNGFWGACSTYGSFSYLKYGRDAPLQPTRPGLRAQGRQGPLGGGSLRARDRGGLAHALRDLRARRDAAVPRGHVIDLHPWEYNEVPVVLGAALATDVPIVALHLTRPADRACPTATALGMPSPLRGGPRGLRAPGVPSRAAARLGRSSSRARSRRRTWSRSFPSSTQRGLNVKVVAAISPQLFRRQDGRLPGRG